MSAFDDEEYSPKRQDRWTGVLMATLTAPVFFFFAHLGKVDFGFTASMALAMALIAIKLRWKLRKHAWFWGTIAVILALHIPILLIAPPLPANIPTIAYAFPLGLVEFALINGAISLAEKVFSKGDPSDEDG
jgi:hypothetical protein